MAELTEIRWHGRGGQGVVTAGELLAETALGVLSQHVILLANSGYAAATA